MVICAILSLTRSVKFLKDLTDYNKSLNYLILVDTNRYKQIFFLLKFESKIYYCTQNKKEHITLLIRPYSPMSKKILQSFKFVLNHNLCKMRGKI